MIPAAQGVEIRRLFFAEHWRVGTIAAQLGCHPDTVRRALETARFARPAVVRPSVVDPYRRFLQETLAQYPRLRATRLFAMVQARGYPGSIVQLRRVVRTLRPASGTEAYLRRTLLPGEEGQVDWGCFGRLQIGRATRALSAFVLVLSWSRALHAVFTLDQSLESFLRGHVAAFQALGGVPRVLLLDNLKSAVLERQGDAIRYLREAFFAARTFRDVADLNAQFVQWRDTVAHARRVPGDPTRTVAEALVEERARLLPLPAHPAPTALVKPVTSGKQPHIRFDRNWYSIPYPLVRVPLTLVAAADVVQLYHGTEEVANHLRSYDADFTVEARDHLAGLVAAKRAAQPLTRRDRLFQAVPAMATLLDRLACRGEPLGPAVARLHGLLGDYGALELTAAVESALARDAVSAGAIAHELERRRRRRGQRPPVPLVLPADPRVRDLDVPSHPLETYDALTTFDAPDPAAE